jgi:hypothetical protein
VAIKGKAKRSQGRPVRRVTPGPRPAAVERRVPWHRTAVFMVMVAVIALVVTALAAVTRVQQGWARDDVARFTTALDGPLDRVAAITGAGTNGKPGFTSAAELTSGKIKPEELGRRATNWATALSGLHQEIAGVRVGDPEVKLTPDGVPTNDVGSRVPVLTGIRDTYVAGVASFELAAALYGQAAKAPAAQRQGALQAAQTAAQSGQQTLDAVASSLAIVRAEQGLDVTGQLPGESNAGYGTRMGSGQSGDPTQLGGLGG